MGELHPHTLSDPEVNLSAHPAPIDSQGSFLQIDLQGPAGAPGYLDLHLTAGSATMAGQGVISYGSGRAAGAFPSKNFLPNADIFFWTNV